MDRWKSTEQSENLAAARQWTKDRLDKVTERSDKVYSSTLYHLAPCKKNRDIGVYVQKEHWAHSINSVSVQLSRAVELDDDLTLDRLLSSGDGLDGNTTDAELLKLVDVDGFTLLGHAVRGGKARCIALLEMRGAELDEATRLWVASKPTNAKLRWQNAVRSEVLKNADGRLDRQLSPAQRWRVETLGCQVHVRGIGADGWDGTPDGVGHYENFGALAKIFSPFGDFEQATVRHCIEGTVNTSWALVTMANPQSVDAILKAHEEAPIYAGSSRLVLNRFDKKAAKNNTGRMVAVQMQDDLDRARDAGDGVGVFGDAADSAKHVMSDSGNLTGSERQLLVDQDDNGKPKGYSTGKGLENPGGYLWAFAMTIVNNYQCTFAHLHRAFNPNVLTGLKTNIRGDAVSEAASEAEVQWLNQYAHLGGARHKKARTLMVWRRSTTIALSFLSIAQAIVLFNAASYATIEFEQLKLVADDVPGSTALDVKLVTDVFFRTTDPAMIQAIHSRVRVPPGAVPVPAPLTMSGLFDTLPANSSCTPVVIPSPTAPPVGAALDNLAANGGLRRLRRRLQAPPPPPQTAFKYTECDLYEDLRNETFIEFASRVQEIGVARVVQGAEQVQVWVMYFIAVTGFWAWVCNMVAFDCWYNLFRSKFWIRLGWGVSFLAPFVISIFPSRMFVDFDKIQPVKLVLMAKFEQDYPLGEMLDNVHTACDPIMGGGLDPILAEMKRYNDQAVQMQELQAQAGADTGYDELGWPTGANVELPAEFDPANAPQVGTCTDMSGADLDAIPPILPTPVPVDVRLTLSQQQSDCTTTGNTWNLTATNCVAGYTVGTVAMPSTTCPNGCMLTAAAVNDEVVEACDPPPTCNFTTGDESSCTGTAGCAYIAPVGASTLAETCLDGTNCNDPTGAGVVAADEAVCTSTGYTWELVDNTAVAGAAQGAAADRLSTRNPAEDLEKMQLAYTQLENIIAIMESGCEKLSKLEDALPVGLSYSEVQDMGKPCPPGVLEVCKLPDCAAGCELRIVVNGTNGTATSQQANIAFDEVNSLVQKTMQGVEIYVGLLYGLRGFKIMLPAALSLGPGMVEGALNVKLIVPQSSLPGFIVTLLPWMYCPLMWCIYNFAAQALNSVWMLIGLVMLAYFPMAFVIVGNSKEISKPMTDEEAYKVTGQIKQASSMLMLLGLICIGIFAWKANQAGDEEFELSLGKDIAGAVIRNMFKFAPLAQLCLGFMSKKLYTTLAAVDFILDIIIADRRHEQMLEDLKVKKKVKTCCGKHCLEGRFNRCFGRKCTACVDADQADLDDDLSTEKRAQADEVEMMTIRVNVYDRKDRLDDLVHLMELAVDEEFRGRKEKTSDTAAVVLGSKSWKAAVRAAPWDGGYGHTGAEYNVPGFLEDENAQPIGVLKVGIKGATELAPPTADGDGASRRPFVMLRMEQEGMPSQKYDTRTVTAAEDAEEGNSDTLNPRFLTSDGRTVAFFFDVMDDKGELLIDVIDDKGEEGGELGHLIGETIMDAAANAMKNASHLAADRIANVGGQAAGLQPSNAHLGQARLKLKDVLDTDASTPSEHDLSLENAPRGGDLGTGMLSRGIGIMSTHGLERAPAEIVTVGGNVQIEMQFFFTESVEAAPPISRDITAVPEVKQEAALEAKAQQLQPEQEPESSASEAKEEAQAANVARLTALDASLETFKEEIACGVRP